MSNTRVTEIVQDKNGFIWIGTHDGLNRFDSYQFKHYFNDIENPNSLLSNMIKGLHLDLQNQLWVSTDQGLNAYSSQDNFQASNENDSIVSYLKNKIIFKSFSHKKSFISSVQKGLVIKQKNSIFYIDSIPIANNMVSIKDDLFVTTPFGIVQIDLKKKKTYTFKYPIISKRPLTIGSLTKFSDDELLVSIMGHGMFKFSIARKTFTEIPELKISQITGVLNHSDGNIWISDEKNGISIYDRSFTKRKSLLENESISSLMESKNKLVFAGTYTKGFYVIDKLPLKFKSIELGGKNGIYGINKTDYILSTLTFKDGLIRYNLETSKREVLNKSNGLNSNDLTTITKFNDNLWIGTFGSGINILKNDNTAKFKMFENRTLNYVNVFEYNKDTLFIGSYGGLIIHPRNSEIYDHISFSENKNKRNNYIVSIKDSKSYLWLGTADEGLIRFNKSSREHVFIKSTSEKHSLNSNSISDILISSDYKLYLATSSGLSISSLENPDSLSFTHINRKNGLLNESIYSIIEDQNKDIWMSTGYGVGKLKTETNQFTLYLPNDGLSDYEFNNNSKFIDQDGKMYFGGVNGVSIINPNHINQNKFKPEVVLTEFRLFNKIVSENSDKLNKEINLNQSITLNYDDYVFSLSFALLNYTNSSQNTYSYKLEGFNDSWISNGTNNSVTFTNLDPGEYNLNIKGFNNDGIESYKIKSLRIIVLPPWWKTIVAYLFYIIVFIYIIYYYIRRKEKERKRLEKLVYNRTKEVERQRVELQELDQIKSRFFQNISHEFRLPLTLIISPIEEALRVKKEAMLTSVLSNAKRLLKLVNQLIDLSSIDHKKIKMIPSIFNIKDSVNVQIEMLRSSAESNEINIKTNLSDISVEADKDKIEHILSNIFSNAIKFAKSTISICLEIKNGCVAISCVDDGIGISKKDQEKIFDRFFQSDNSETREYEGTGIGLSLVKDFVDLHSGSISVNSELGNGATFYLFLPILTEKKEQATTKLALTEKVVLKSLKQDKKLPKILIIEDSEEIRTLLINQLSNEFYILEAENGDVGAKLAVKELPKLVLVDIMMPKKDGYTVVKELKDSILTSHIPMIMLTAKSDKESELKGLNVGADDYITKPFNIEEIRLKLRNHIQRVRRHQIEIQGLNQVSDIHISKLDSELINRIKQFIHDNMQSYDFSYDLLYSEIGMSQSTFYRKLKSLTAETPSSFLLNYRLDFAADKLKEGSINISEVSNLVGISNPSYFSRTFTKKFGISPKEYQKNL